MKLLEERILRDGEVRPGNILKVDGFLNHCMDIALFNEMGRELRRLFPEDVTKLLTIEASGIGLACIAAQYFGNVPVVFAKKYMSKNIDPNEIYTAEIKSYTKGTVYNALVSRRHIGPDDKILIIDDFLASGAALMGLKSLCDQAGAHIVGAGIAIEKTFQDGGRIMRERGMRIESLARIAYMDDSSVRFE